MARQPTRSRPTLSVVEFRSRIDAMLSDAAHELERTRHVTDAIRLGLYPETA